MWTTVFFILFAGTLAVLIVVLIAFTKKIAEVEKQRSDLEVEETRVFDFLHGLGEAFSEGVRPIDLHRLIVEGAVRVLEAAGGALYLQEKSGGALVPAFVTRHLPPPIALPPGLLAQEKTVPGAVESYVKLHSLKVGQGMVGGIFEDGQIRIFGRADLDFGDDRPVDLQPASAIAAPLLYRRKTLGVLILVNKAESIPFKREETALFRTIAEQSAFALYNEAVYLEASHKKRMDRDLQMAREVQGVLLPSDAPQFPGFEIDGINIPANQVSGDYFDFIPLPDNRLGIVIADVSGKGLPASLIMAMCRTVIRSQAASARSPSDLLKRVNRLLYPDIKEDMFISMAYFILHAGEGEIQMARAGHDPPLFFESAKSEVRTMSSKGMALGIDSGDVFDRICEDVSVKLQPGDALLLYTDGASESLDRSGAEFGLANLRKGLGRRSSEPAGELVRNLAGEITQFIGDNHLYDDITLIAVKKL